MAVAICVLYAMYEQKERGDILRLCYDQKNEMKQLYEKKLEDTSKKLDLLMSRWIDLAQEKEAKMISARNYIAKEEPNETDLLDMPGLPDDFKGVQIESVDGKKSHIYDMKLQKPID